MSDRKPTKSDVRKWLTTLAARVKPTVSVDEIKRQIDLAVPMLMAKLPAAAFCGSAMDALVAAHRFPTFPTEAEILEALGRWWHDSDPNAAHKMPDWIAESGLDVKAQRWIKSWDAKRDVIGLDFLRRHHALGYAWLIDVDTDAAGIAWTRGWLRHTPTALAQSWDDPDLTVRIVQRILEPMHGGGFWPDTAGFLALMRSAIAAHAPQHLHLVPDSVPGTPEIASMESAGLFGGL